MKLLACVVSFSCWRYRDVKLLGKFSAADAGEGMIVEIQVIDKTFLEAQESGDGRAGAWDVFPGLVNELALLLARGPRATSLEVKRFMHKPFTVARGDFW